MKKPLHDSHESDEFSIHLQSKNDLALITLKGEFNLYSSHHLKEMIQKIIDSEYTNILIDASLTSYIDSSALGVILGTHAKLKKQDGFISFLNPSRQVMYVLELTKLAAIFKIYSSVEELDSHNK